MIYELTIVVATHISLGYMPQMSLLATKVTRSVLAVVTRAAIRRVSYRASDVDSLLSQIMSYRTASLGLLGIGAANGYHSRLSGRTAYGGMESINNIKLAVNAVMQIHAMFDRILTMQLKEKYTK